MDVGLSDLLTCPRCGPVHGLILRPDEIMERRVRTGVLGCANCRERYPVEEWVADLRTASGAGGSEVSALGATGGGGRDEAVRLGAALGLAGVRGTILVGGSGAAHAGALAELVPEVSVVAVGSAFGPVREPAAESPSGLRVDTALPFRDGSFVGVALTGRQAALRGEGLRVLRRPGRLLLDPAPAGSREWLESRGVPIVLAEKRLIVAGGTPAPAAGP